MNDAIRARTASMPPPELCPRHHHRARGEAAPHWPLVGYTNGAQLDAGGQERTFPKDPASRSSTDYCCKMNKSTQLI